MNETVSAIEEAIAGLDKTVSHALEMAKISGGYAEKLIVLDGATLALTISAVAAFSHKSGGPALLLPGVAFLLFAWKLLFTSAILSLAAQWGMANANGMAVAMVAQLRGFVGLSKTINSFAPNDAPDRMLRSRATLLERLNRAPTRERRAKLLVWGSVTLGALASVTTAGAFICIYKFLSAAVIAT